MTNHPTWCKTIIILLHSQIPWVRKLDAAQWWHLVSAVQWLGSQLGTLRWLGVEITWKLLHSHVCCPAGMTQTSWTLDKGTDMWTLCVAWALWGLDSEKEQAESKCCKKMDGPREASWLFLTFIGGHAPLLLPPRPKGREMEPPSWWRCSQFTLKKSTLDGRCYRPSWSSEDTVFHTLASSNRATFLAHTKSSVDPGSSPRQMCSCWLSNTMLLPSCSFSISTCGPQPLLQGKTTHRLLGATTCKGPRSLLLTFHGSCSQA